MKIRRLDAINFCAFHEPGIQLDLQDRGLVLVTGENRDSSLADSNGAGKSLLLDALCWCIWGNTTRGLKSDDVVNNKINKNCKVTLELFDELHTYKITRFRKYDRDKPNDLILEIDGSEYHTGASVKDTQAKIEEILGLDFFSFCAMMPGTGVKLAGLTDADIKALLERILRTEEFAKASVLVSKDRAEKDVELSLAQQKLSLGFDALDKAMKKLEYTKERAETFEDQQRTKVNDIDRTIKSLITKRQTKERALHTGVEQEIAQINEKLLLQNESFKNLKNLKDERFRKNSDEIFEDKTNLALVKQAINLAHARLIKIQHLGPSCSECASELPESYRHDLQTQVKRELDNQNAILRDIDARLDATKKVCARDMDKLDEQLTASSKLLENLKALRKKLFEKHDFNKLAIQEIKSLTKQEQTLQNQREKIIAETCPFDEMIAQEEATIASLENETEQTTKTCSTLALEIEDLRFWQSSFSPKGIRNYLLDSVIPFLNERSEYYSQLLTNGDIKVVFKNKRQLKNKQFKEEFHIDVDTRFGADSYKGSSSGERARVDLIVAMSVGDLAALRSKKTLSFKFFDEPFENMDESGTDAVLALLRSQSERFGTILVITHNDSFKQKFEQKVNVVKQSGSSKLVS